MLSCEAGTLASSFKSDTLIGSAVIDLEDRWHSERWKEAGRRRMILAETRLLYNPDMQHANCGSIDMWVETLDGVKASDSDEKATDFRAPPIAQIEVRLAIRTTTHVPNMGGNHTHAKVTMGCNEYQGDFPKVQEIDAHPGCQTGKAEINWRIVFPMIDMPTKSCVLELCILDANAITADVPIGAVSLDIRKYVDEVARDMELIFSKGADLPAQRHGCRARAGCQPTDARRRPGKGPIWFVHLHAVGGHGEAHRHGPGPAQ